MGINGSIVDTVMVILAAGLASRMQGRSKPDLPWIDGFTLLEHQVHIAELAGFSVMVVSRIARPIQRTAINAAPETGISGSLQVGLRAIREGFGPINVGVMLADQPFVRVSDVIYVYEQFCRRSLAVHAVRPVYDDVPGHPVFFDASWDPVVMSMSQDRGLGGLWRERSDAASIDVFYHGDRNPTFDIDTDEAYRQALKWARREAK